MRRALRALFAKLLALGMLALPGALLAVLVWQLYGKLKEDAQQSITDGRAAIISLPSGDVQGARRLQPTAMPQVNEDIAVVAESALIPPPGEGLKIAPSESITENTESGPLPKIAADGTKPWQYYARDYSKVGNAPVVSVVVTGLGLNHSVSDMALKLPPNVTLSLSPYAQDVGIWAGSARALGHEVMIDLPMESEGYPAVDPGPMAQLLVNSAEENEQRLRMVLTRFPGYIGVLASASERFTANEPAAAALYAFLSSRGLMMAMGSAPTAQPVQDLLKSSGLPNVKAAVSVAPDMTQEMTYTRLNEVEGTARKAGSALIIIPPTPAALRAVAEWVEAADKKGLIIVPVSALARLTFS